MGNAWNNFKESVADSYDYVVDQVSKYPNVQSKVAALKSLNRESIKHIHAPIRKGERMMLRPNMLNLLQVRLSQT